MLHDKRFLSAGRWQVNKVRALYAADLSSALIRDVRDFTSDLTRINGISDGEWPEMLVDLHRDFSGAFTDRSGNRLVLDTEILFRRDRKAMLVSAHELDRLDRLDPEEFGEIEDPMHYRTWYRDNLMKPAGLRVRIDNALRWSVVVNILKIAFPAPAMMWGVRPANDNSPLQAKRPLN